MLSDHTGIRIRKAKDYLEINLTKDMKSNEKRFFRHINSKRKARKK